LNDSSPPHTPSTRRRTSGVKIGDKSPGSGRVKSPHATIARVSKRATMVEELVSENYHASSIQFLPP
jgi:hypothetical protein